MGSKKEWSSGHVPLCVAFPFTVVQVRRLVKDINWFKIFLQFTGTSESGEGVGEAKVVVTAHEWTKTNEGVARWEQLQLPPLQSFSGEHICYQQQFHVAASCLLSTITFSDTKTNSWTKPNQCSVLQ